MADVIKCEPNLDIYWLHISFSVSETSIIFQISQYLFNTKLTKIQNKKNSLYDKLLS